MRHSNAPRNTVVDAAKQAAKTEAQYHCSGQHSRAAAQCHLEVPQAAE